MEAGPPGVTLEMNMPSSFGLYGVDPKPPAIDKPRPLSPRSKRISILLTVAKGTMKQVEIFESCRIEV